MNGFSNLKIATRLALGFGSAVLLMVAIAAAAKIGLERIDGAIEAVGNDRYPKVKMVGEITRQLNQQARSARNLMIMDAPGDLVAEKDRIAETRKLIGETYDKLGPLLNTDAGKALFAQLLERRAAYVAHLDPFIAAVDAGDTVGARQVLLGSLRNEQLAYMKALDALRESVEAQMALDVAGAKAQVGTTEALMFGAVLLGALLCAGFGAVVARSVTTPVKQAVATLSRVAEGDLALPPPSARRDELGQLLGAISRTVDSLRRVVSEVRSGVDSVTTASSQIAAGNTDLSSRTEQQASSLQETASSMEQLTGTVQQSADTARQADQLAGAARSAAVRGGETVGQVVATMEQISHASKRIADIIGTIDGIAFQTNILALNAAVEAARAGEQGRGFAVVAGEVRSLAQRSAEAAKEIKSLIGASVEQVEVGARQVADAGAAMNDIVGQVGRVSDLIGELTSAASEQSSGIGQVNTAVSEMDRVTQQNAALVEESAAAAQSLAHQAERLAGVVSQFRLAGAGAAA